MTPDTVEGGGERKGRGTANLLRLCCGLFFFEIALAMFSLDFEWDWMIFGFLKSEIR